MQIREVPSEIIQLSRLETLFLSENLLTLLPIELCDMSHLTRLEFDKNDIDFDDPVMKMKRQQRENKVTSPRVLHTSELWDGHKAEMAKLQQASSKQDEERMNQRKL